MKRFAKLALLAGLAIGAADLTTPTEARADVHIGLGFFGPPAPVYYAPPAYYPAPVYHAYPAYHYHYAPPIYRGHFHRHYGPRCW